MKTTFLLRLPKRASLNGAASLLALLAILLPFSGRCDEPGLITKSGDSIAFLGDSITQQGAASPAGYVYLVINGLEQQGQKVTAIPAGISGHTSKDMLARLDRDVISKKPTWMTLSCGVNDVWHGANGVELEPYKQNITAIVDKAQAAGIKVIMLTATMIQENQTNASTKSSSPTTTSSVPSPKTESCRSPT